MGNYKVLPSPSPPISVTNVGNDIGHLVLNDGGVGCPGQVLVKYTIGHYKYAEARELSMSLHCCTSSERLENAS